MGGLVQKSRTQILEDLETFMKRHASPRSDWYVGTAADARKEMFDVHGFKASDVGLYRHAGSDSDAASLAGLLIKRGAKGDGTTKRGATNIFLFKMAAHTKPALGQ
jgi:hypothetical protein